VLRPRKASRLCLHAVRLAFPHPFGGHFLEFESPLPADIARHFESRPEALPKPSRSSSRPRPSPRRAK